MAAMSEGFFERWSRRKQQVRDGQAIQGDVAPVPAASEPPSSIPVQGSTSGGRPPGMEGAPPDTLPLTLADAEALNMDSDFKPFIARDVAPEVRNAAFRKLFADPHFNLMDGLDTYVDDYSRPSPLPDSALRQMASARLMKLVDDPQDGQETPADAGLPAVAESNDPVAHPSPPTADARPDSQETDDHHADLRLQQDDASRGEGARRGSG